jgi:N-methylhydantoinase A/oxoprolinase/acetone carboxylase beta subunit
MRIGIDVGGTNTDAVLLDGERVVAWCKSPTTADVSGGIVRSIRTLLHERPVHAQIDCVVIGTTQFTNAFVERRSLVPVGVIRLALPATAALPPMSTWPDDLRAVLGDAVHLVRGGYQFDGRINSELDEAAVAEATDAIAAAGIRSVAISGLFSLVNDAMERRAAEIVRARIPTVRITLSHRIGRPGLLERENAAIMNASLADLSTRVVGSFSAALRELAIDVPFYITQNDGTLMSAEAVEAYPVLTFASGPTNSMRGAAHLSGMKDGLVADIGGTTTDIGVLVGGYPRESSVPVDIGGVRTNFRMPDILALGLGGGSIIAPDASAVGPQSVGHRLLEEALVFGGATLTATDIAVAKGAEIGDPALVAHLPEATVTRASDAMHATIEEGIDRLKTRAGDIDLVLVGGGAVLVDRPLAGVAQIHQPELAGVANAIGAAIAQVGGEVDRVYAYEKIGRDAALADARDSAIAIAVEAGADPDSTAIIDLEELPLAYVPGGAVRVRAKAAGALRTPRRGSVEVTTTRTIETAYGERT